jgi:DNA-binding NtrC family response regulator
MIRVLMIDDEIRQAGALRKKLTNSGIKVKLVSSAADVAFLSRKERFDVVLLDTRLSDMHGLGLFEKLKFRQRTLPVIIYTDNKDVDAAVRYMKRGANDYLIKPCDFGKLNEVIRKAARKGANNKALERHGHLEKRSAIDNLIGESEGIRNVRELIEAVATSQSPVLILGETGTGKELVARAIHDQSLRRRNPLVVVNAGTLQESILESELFGYRKGAFTGALSDKRGLLQEAHNGTCFIDEVGDMKLSIQAKILRVVESGVFMKLGDTRETKVDVRFLFATNRNLASSVEDGSFRKDLFYRINAFTVNLPPLKERGYDIILLASHFLKRFAREEKQLSQEVMKLLTAYDWPGNVRELANAIQRSVLISGINRTITQDHFPENISVDEAKLNQENLTPQWETNLAKRQELHVVKVLHLADGNKSEAARLLGISRITLNRKLALWSA